MTIKVDLGIVFPGLVVLLIGIGLFVLWLLLAILSFFLFFAPALRWVFFVGLYVLVASLVLMAGGVLIMVAATSAWRRGDRHSWLDERSQLRASRDRMSPARARASSSACSSRCSFCSSSWRTR